MLLILLGIIIGIVAAGFYAMVAADSIDGKVSMGIVIVLFLLPTFIGTALASTASVGTGQVAVMTRFGRVTGQELGEGFHIKNPLDKTNKYDIKTLKEQANAASASKDLQDINATLVINYHLDASRVSDIHQHIGPQYKVKLIDPAVQEIFKAATAKYNATELITDRTKVKADSYELLKNRLAGYGIEVTDLSITNFNFSPEFAQAIEDKQVAAQKAQRAEYNLKQAELDAKAQNVQKTSLSPLLLQKEAIEKWNGKMPTYIGGGSVFNIPLGGK